MKKAVVTLLISLLFLASCKEEIPEHVCSFGPEGEVVRKANCTEDGELLFVCECGKEKRELITRDGTHDYADGKCTVCGKIKPSEGLKMKLINNQYYSVSRLGDCTDKDIVIPDTYEGLPVKQIERNAFLNTNIESIYLPSSIEKIKLSAFAQCDSLKKVYIDDLAAFVSIEFEAETNTGACKANPVLGSELYLNGELVTDLVTPTGVTIAPYAFVGCTSIKSVTFSEGTTHIGEYAFSKCSALEILRFSSTVEVVGKYAFKDCEAIKEVHAASIASWCNIEFSQRNSDNKAPSNPIEYTKTLLIDGEPVTDLVIPGTVTEVKPFTFDGCETIKSVVLEEGVKEIGYSAFSFCESLRVLTLPSTIEKIDGWSFYQYNDEGIKRINIANIDSWITATQNYSMLNNNTELYLNNELVTSVVVPSGIKTLGVSFYNYVSLNEIIINGGLVEITAHALAGTSITSLNIPDGVTKIGEGAFSRCTGLAEVILPKSLEEIGASAFLGCTSLRKLELPEKIDTISEYLFKDCLHLHTLTIHPTVKVINLNAFIRSGISKINYLGTREDWKKGSIRVNSKDYGELKQIDDIIVYGYADEEETTKAG